MKNYKLINKSVLAGVILTSSMSVSKAALVLTISGTAGSNIVSITASGDGVIADGNYAEKLSNAGLAPVGGSWDPDYDNNIGDALQTFTGSLNDDLAISAPISYKKNGTEFGTVSFIDFDPFSGNGDDIELDAEGLLYPALVQGDIFSWSGSGTVTLEIGTFDTVFNIGEYTKNSGAVEYTVNVVNAVPEPSSTFLFGIGFFAFVLKRRRS